MGLAMIELWAGKPPIPPWSASAVRYRADEPICTRVARLSSEKINYLASCNRTLAELNMPARSLASGRSTLSFAICAKLVSAVEAGYIMFGSFDKDFRLLQYPDDE